MENIMSGVKNVVYDLDNTLIDAERVKWFFRQLALRHGFTEEESREIYRQARNEEDGKIAITDERFLRFLEETLTKQGKQLDNEIVEKVFSEVEKEKEKLLFPGAVELIEFCKQQKIENSLLSLGVKEWQKKKMRWVGLDKFFHDKNTVFTVEEDGGKREALQKLFGKDFTGEGVVLFNDRPDESGELLDTFPGLKIFVRRDMSDTRHNEEVWGEFMKKYEGRAIVATDLKNLLEKFKEYVGPKEGWRGDSCRR